MKAFYTFLVAMLFLGSVAAAVKTSPAFKFADSGQALASGGPQDLPALPEGALTSSENGDSGQLAQNSPPVGNQSGQVLGASADALTNSNRPIPKVSPSDDPIRGVNFSPLAAANASRPQVLGESTNTNDNGAAGEDFALQAVGGSISAADNQLDYSDILSQQDNEIRASNNDVNAAINTHAANQQKSEATKKALIDSLKSIAKAGSSSPVVSPDGCGSVPGNLPEDPAAQEAIAQAELNKCKNYQNNLQAAADQQIEEAKQKSAQAQAQIDALGQLIDETGNQ